MMHNNGGLGFAIGSLGIEKAGLPDNNFVGSSSGTAGLGNNTYVGLTGCTGASFGVDGLSNPLSYTNLTIFSLFSSNMGGFGANTTGHSILLSIQSTRSRRRAWLSGVVMPKSYS